MQALRLIAGWAIAGCAIGSAVGCGAAPVRDDRDARAAPSKETFVVAIGGSVTIDGEALQFVGLSPAPHEGAPFAASLARVGGGSIDVTSPGCTRDGAWVYSLEALDAGTQGFARFARSPASDDVRALAWGEPIEIGPGENLAAPDGWTYTLGEVRADHPSVWVLEVVGVRRLEGGEIERVEHALDAQAESPRESAIDAEHHVKAWTTARVDALGCPVVRIVVEQRELGEPELLAHEPD